MRLDKFEESLKEIKLKLYYIIPKVQADKYDLENFHFDAYIPTLLPLLTGDNLYKSKEVFIRELVQNSIDATLLRTKMQVDSSLTTDILIILGTEERNGKRVKYFKITDYGTGMSKFTIERYFTSIGRSYYVSEEFDDLKKDKEIHYEAISNFGIGFLSSFMVCKEVLVKTKSIAPAEGFDGLEIEIPNYDGCFFIRKIEKERFGTEITLFEDERALFNFQRFLEYIKKNLLGLPLKIEVRNLDTKRNTVRIEAFKIQKNILKLAQTTDLIFYIPFSEQNKSVTKRSWIDLIGSDFSSLDTFGIWVNFSKIKRERFSQLKGQFICLNQGLSISTPFLPFELKNEDIYPQITINYPSSFIQLDVAREKILRLKPDVDLTGIVDLIHDQVFEFFLSKHTRLENSKLSDLFILNYILYWELGLNTVSTVYPELYTLKVHKLERGFEISLCKIKEIVDGDSSEDILYLDLVNRDKPDKYQPFFDPIISGIRRNITEGPIPTDKFRAKFKEYGLDTFFGMTTTLSGIQHFTLNPDFQQEFFINERIETRTVIRSKLSGGKTYEFHQMMQFNPIENFDNVKFQDIFVILCSVLIESFKGKKGKNASRGFFEALIVAKAIIFNNLTVGDVASAKYVFNFEDFVSEGLS